MENNGLCIHLISDGYTTDDIKLQWANQKDPVKKYKDITMSQFTLVKILHGNKTMSANHGKNTQHLSPNYSCTNQL